MNQQKQNKNNTFDEVIRAPQLGYINYQKF